MSPNIWYNISMATEMDKLKREFLEYLEIEKGSSLKTIENYERYLNRFLEFTKINKCYYCDGDIKWHAYWVEGKRNNHYNLDRKNNNEGYTKNNCVVCCELCNYMKRMKTPDQFIQHCKNIVNHQQKTVQL